jgi:Tol biopolymer transport system component
VSRDPSHPDVRAQLTRILSSDLFTRSDRLSAFLKYIVEETLEGRGDSLKEQVLAMSLYGKGADFNTAADPIVRVDARRLRDKLREYYAASPRDPVVITVPKGSYTPAFELNGVPTAHTRVSTPVTVAPHSITAPRRWVRIGLAAATIIMLSAVVWWLIQQRYRSGIADSSRLLTVTSFPGSEDDPSLSPDGNFVAFSWSGSAEGGNKDIWVKSVEGNALRQLTDTPDVFEGWPAWSPDGRHIAFTRSSNGPPSVWVISALGGVEHRVREGAAMATWTPDSESLVMGSRKPDGRLGLIHHSVRTGTSRQLTKTPTGFFDQNPRVSPDGKMLAFSRHGSGRASLFVMSMAGGEARQRTPWAAGLIGGLSWAPDGRDVLFARPEMSGRRMVRIAASGSDAAVAVAGVPHGAVSPSVSRSRDGPAYRLAFANGHPDIALRMIDLGADRPGAKITAVQPFCDATRMDVPGRFSPDGEHVAFASDRSGTGQVWIARRDGSGVRSLTDLPSAVVNVGSWSPDGRWVAFDAMIAENRDLYAVRVDGGPARRLTDDAAPDIDGEWSRDGRWIYYASTASGRSEIWKMRADGSGRVQLTSEGGFEPRESPDGRAVYFVDKRRGYGMGSLATLKRVPIEGGRADVVHSGVFSGAWDVTDTGITFIMGRAVAGLIDTSRAVDVLAEYDFAERRVRRLGELPFQVARAWVDRFLIASRDGRWAVASHVDRVERDIMVLDTFR